MNKFIKYICLTFIISISIFCTEITNVKAGTPDGSGNANCFYLSKDNIPIANNDDSPTVEEYTAQYKININVYRNTEGYFEGTATISGSGFKYCTTTYSLLSDPIVDCVGSDEITGNNGWTITTDSINEFFSDSDKLKEKFYSYGSWKCPNTIYERRVTHLFENNFGPGSDSKTVEIGWEKKGNLLSCSLTEDKSVQEGHEEASDDDFNEKSTEEKEKADIEKIQDAYKVCRQVLNGDKTDWYIGKDPVSEEEFQEQCFNYETTNCSMFDDDIIGFLNKFFWIISIAGILLLVIMTMVEFIKALTGSDDSGLIKAFKHTLIRIVVVIILLLLPIIVTFILNLVNRYSEYTIGEDGNVTCGVGN